MRVLLIAALFAAMILPPAVSQAGIFRRRDGTPRQPVRTSLQAIGHHCHGGQCRGTYRNGPWGCRSGN